MNHEESSQDGAAELSLQVAKPRADGSQIEDPATPMWAAGQLKGSSNG